jgi:hypothetical protein
MDDRFAFFAQQPGLLIQAQGRRFGNRSCKLTYTHGNSSGKLSRFTVYLALTGKPEKVK